MTRRRARSRPSEQLLPGGLPADSALARLLADASAPAQPHEHEGLSAAVTAFTASQPNVRRSPVKTLLASLLAAKAALVATVATASVGGIALAAATGTLPTAAQNAAHDLVHAPAAASAHSAALDESHPTTPPTPSASSSPSPSASPSPSLVGLCRAYSAGVATAKGKALDNPAFTVLITAAGGEDAVAAYCDGVLAAAPGGKPTALPTPTNTHKPTTHPATPTTHPTGQPSEHPTAPSQPARP
jgi:hypothetical protein